MARCTRPPSFFDFFLIEEIKKDIKGSCEEHRLPIAQFWFPCNHSIYEHGCRRYDENETRCFSSASDSIHLEHPNMYLFIDACCKHHFLKGQGVVGKAFATNQPWFATDISSIPKTEYPLSDYARMLGLHSAIAIPLLIITSTSGMLNFVLEFFLPLHCTDLEEQKKTVTALISTLRKWAKETDRKGDDFPAIQLVLQPLKVVEQSGANDSLFQGENMREASAVRLLSAPGDQNVKYNLDSIPTIEITKVGQAIDQGSFLSPAVSETSEERHATGDKIINVPGTSVNVAAKSTTGGKRTRGGGGKRDWAWKYCSTIEGNGNGVKCSFCKLEIKGGGITRFKSHISGNDPSKNAKKCKNVPPEVKIEIEKKIKSG